MRPTFCDMRQLRQELVEFLLPLIQFATASVVDSKKRHNAVDNEETVLIANKEFGNFVQELHLVLGVDSTSVSDVVLGCTVLVCSHLCGASVLTGLRIDTVALSNLGNSLWSEGTFRICGTWSEPP
jgi:hypothetical protein